MSKDPTPPLRKDSIRDLVFDFEGKIITFVESFGAVYDALSVSFAPWPCDRSANNRLATLAPGRSVH